VHFDAVQKFKTELKSIYENHIKALGQKLDITVVRANEIFTTKPFINKVWDGIYGADLIIEASAPSCSAPTRSLLLFI
jgi:hypothetical protein